MNHIHRRELILKGSMPKVILTLAAPIMLSNLIQTMYNLGDTYWISRLGESEVAAMGLVFPIIFLIISLGMGMNVAGTALISQYIGSDNPKEANVIAGQLFSLSLVISIVLSTIGFLTTPQIVHLIGGRGDVFIHSTQYLQIMFWEMPFIFLFFVFNAIKQGQGDTVTPMILNGSGVILNILLDPIFIFTFNLGIRGAAFATIFSRSIFALYAAYTLFKGTNGIRLTRHLLIFNKEVLLRIIKVGLPASIGQSAAACGFIILNAFVISYGDGTLAAFTIGNRINSLVLMPAMGIGSALATIIGQNLGADQIERAKLAFKTSICLSTIFMTIGGLILYITSSFVVQLFARESFEVARLGTEYLRLISLSIPLMGIFQILIGTFQGSGHTIYAMFIDMTRLWGLRIPMILLFGKYTNWGSSGVWYAMVISNAMICLIGFGIYLQGSWQQQVVRQKSLA